MIGKVHRSVPQARGNTSTGASCCWVTWLHERERGRRRSWAVVLAGPTGGAHVGAGVGGGLHGQRGPAWQGCLLRLGYFALFIFLHFSNSFSISTLHLGLLCMYTCVAYIYTS